MPFHFSPTYFLHYVLKRQATQFFASIAIRYLALGMVLIFEPIYLYLYFDKSLSLTMLFFAAMYGMFGLLVVFGGKIMSRIGPKHSMLFSHFFFFGYYLALFFLYYSFWLVPLIILLRAIGMTLFWPAFNTDFCRFLEKKHHGREIGKLNVVCMVPVIISPIIGGWILATFNYQVLFTIVLVVLFASTIPLFLSREVHIVYTDSYRTAWGRILKKSNKRINLAMAANGVEGTISMHCWPIFMAVLAIGYETMGELTTFALAMGALFTLYMGRLSDRLINRVRFLNIGSALTSISWIIKFFVTTPFTAFLAHTIYRISRTTASIPYQALIFGKAFLKGPEVDEFMIYREIVLNMARTFFFIMLAILFFFIPQINLAFIVAAIVSLGFMFLGVPPRILKKLKWAK